MKHTFRPFAIIRALVLENPSIRLIDIAASGTRHLSGTQCIDIPTACRADMFDRAWIFHGLDGGKKPEELSALFFFAVNTGRALYNFFSRRPE